MATSMPSAFSHDALRPPDLSAWCKAVGIRNDAVEIRTQNGMRGLYATRDILPGEEIISVPATASLITDMEAPPPTFHYLQPSKSYWESIPWETQLAIILLDESLCKNSPFASYIASLPTDPSCVAWAYHTIGHSRLTTQLRPYHMHNLADISRAKLKSRFIALKSALHPKSRHLITLKQFTWAVSVSISRAFGIPPVAETQTDKNIKSKPVKYALFPVLDMANCSVHYQSSLRYDAKADMFRVFTGSPFSKSEQVYVSYGAKSNDDFMFFYGFVEGNNPANTVTIPEMRKWIFDLANIDACTASTWDRKLNILIRQGRINPREPYHFHLDRIEDKLTFLLRITLATSEEIDRIEHTLDSSSLDKPLSLSNELAVWHAIEQKCTEILDEQDDFSSSEQETLKRLFSTTPCTVAWTWGEPGCDGEILYRYEQQSVLTATLERVRHFAKISSSVGRICTVLLPPSQSLLRTDIFGAMTGHDDTSGIHKFDITQHDVQNQLES